MPITRRSWLARSILPFRIVLVLACVPFIAACARLEPRAAQPHSNGSTKPLVAATAPINLDDNKLALAGYDPVSYFEGGTPAKGSPEFIATHNGATYRFASEAHRKLFMENPMRYEPQYGGFCATGIAKGYKVSCDPRNYKVEEGKLYLFHKALFLDASKDWNAEQKQAAERNWKNATTPSTTD